MANPIRRLVQLILDRTSAKKTEDDAKKSLGVIESGLGGLKRAAVAVGAALAAAFGVRALIRLGKESLKQWLDNERAWSELAGTVRAANVDFAKLEPTVTALGAAFQDATTHSNADYAKSLARMITLTEDVAASTNNMGLVANVAAQFYGGQLEPAVELVSKVMGGNITMLQKMGIHVKSAQEGLELLARRSFGAAERQASTFGGRLAQLNNLWNDFQQELGGVLVASGESVGALDVLRGIVVTLTQAVKDNRKELQGGFKTALEGTVIVLDGVYRGVRGVVEVLGGALFVAIGTIMSPVALLAQGLALLAEGGEWVSKALGLKGASAALDGFAVKLRSFAAALKTPTDVGLEMFTEGLKRFTERTQLAEDTLAGIGNRPAPGKGKPLPGATNKPMVSKNIEGKFAEGEGFTDDRLKAIDDAIERAFAQSAKLRAVQKSLRDTVRDFEDSSDAARTFAEAMAGDVGMALDPVGTQLAALDDEASRLTSTMQQLALLGMKATDPLMVQYADRLKQIHAITRETTKAQQFATDVAGIFGEAIGAAMGAGLGPFAAGKAKQTALEAIEELVRGGISLLNPFTAASAPAHFAAAAKFGALSAGWAALSGAFGGSGAGTAGGGSGALASGRGASGGASERAAQIPQEVHIHLVGPGFNALNPEVQRVVFGAQQQARERFGQAARIHLHRDR